MDESKVTEVQVQEQAQVGSCVLLSPHAHPASHIHSWQISYLPNASRQLLPCSEGTSMSLVTSRMKATFRTPAPYTDNKAFKACLTNNT